MYGVVLTWHTRNLEGAVSLTNVTHFSTKAGSGIREDFRAPAFTEVRTLMPGDCATKHIKAINTSWIKESPTIHMVKEPLAPRIDSTQITGLWHLSHPILTGKHGTGSVPEYCCCTYCRGRPFLCARLHLRNARGVNPHNVAFMINHTTVQATMCAWNDYMTSLNVQNTVCTWKKNWHLFIW